MGAIPLMDELFLEVRTELRPDHENLDRVYMQTCAACVFYSSSFRRQIRACGTNTQSVRTSRRTTTSLPQVSSGNSVHGLSAVWRVGQVRGKSPSSWRVFNCKRYEDNTCFFCVSWNSLLSYARYLLCCVSPVQKKCNFVSFLYFRKQVLESYFVGKALYAVANTHTHVLEMQQDCEEGRDIPHAHSYLHDSVFDP